MLAPNTKKAKEKITKASVPTDAHWWTGSHGHQVADHGMIRWRFDRKGKFIRRIIYKRTKDDFVPCEVLTA